MAVFVGVIVVYWTGCRFSGDLCIVIKAYVMILASKYVLKLC
jgi:hypothetical protein